MSDDIDPAGEMRFDVKMSSDRKMVMLDFRGPLTWFEMCRSELEALIEALQEALGEMAP